ncbi:hypothetical protein LRP30_06125 [Bradyrhizobium sp. C-145]|uniref:hypothetical protein n=1 Tax=Bradyrhizobium sp. C-145 TaxID=574727 RepID=UPI00201B84FA|nr:hypothetical protein [Bradyrhizobium sp. C-145]UQR64875.1 hypothetical protein LRP30_06125 [Bradyrhizobium sp. C-145]
MTDGAFGVDHSHRSFVRNLQSFGPIGILKRRNAIRLGKATDNRGEIGARSIPQRRGDIIAIGIAWPVAHPGSVARIHQPPRGIGRQTTRLGGLGEPEQIEHLAHPVKAMIGVQTTLLHPCIESVDASCAYI